MIKPAILLAFAGCTLADKDHCVDPSDCLGGNACVGGSCVPASTTIVGDWFGGLPSDTELDNDGLHFDADGTWTWLHAIEQPGPEQNSRLDPDEPYCETPSSGTGTYTVVGAQLGGGTPHDGTIVLLTAHELDIDNADTTKPFFRIDPPRLSLTCNP